MNDDSTVTHDANTTMHDDVIKMETVSALLALCAGNSPVTGEFPSQRPVTRTFYVFFDLCLINGWVNNREAGDLRRHRAHHDVTVMVCQCLNTKLLQQPPMCVWRGTYAYNLKIYHRDLNSLRSDVVLFSTHAFMLFSVSLLYNCDEWLGIVSCCNLSLKCNIDLKSKFSTNFPQLCFCSNKKIVNCFLFITNYKNNSQHFPVLSTKHHLINFISRLATSGWHRAFDRPSFDEFAQESAVWAIKTERFHDIWNHLDLWNPFINQVGHAEPNT